MSSDDQWELITPEAPEPWVDVLLWVPSEPRLEGGTGLPVTGFRSDFERERFILSIPDDEEDDWELRELRGDIFINPTHYRSLPRGPMS